MMHGPCAGERRVCGRRQVGSVGCCSAEARQIRAVCDGGRMMACRARYGSGFPRRQGSRRRLACSRWQREQQSKATQRNAAGRAIRREAGQRGRATRLPGESQGGGVGSGCELTPSHLLAEVYFITTRSRATVPRASCYKLHVAELLPPRHAPAISMHQSQVACCGSFASIPPICRQREEKEAISSRNSLLETSIMTCLARRPRAPRHTSGTSRRLFRNRECEISIRRSRWPGRLCHHLSLARSPSLSLLPPFRVPFLPPTLDSSAFCHRLSGDPQIPAHTHTHRPGNVF